MRLKIVTTLVTLLSCCLCASSSVARSWAEVPGPSPSTGSILGLATLSDTDVWSVGYHLVNGSNVVLTQHWDGTAWREVPVQMPTNPYSFFTGSTAVSSSDVWAVGYSVDEDGIVLSNLIEHWDGFTWQIVASPNVPFRNNLINAVDAVSSDDIWAVGVVDTTAGEHHYTAGALHWDGSAWAIVPTPMTANAQLQAVHAIASNDVWATGSAGGSTYTLHWNGSLWSVVPSPNGAGPANVLRGVSGKAANDVWAVGGSGTSYLDYVALAMHWDGTAWTVVPTANTSGADPLSAVVALSPRNVIAVGSVGGAPLTERWNGVAWRVVPTPAVEPGAGLTAISAGRRGSLWTSGYQGSDELYLKLAR